MVRALHSLFQKMSTGSDHAQVAHYDEGGLPSVAGPTPALGIEKYDDEVQPLRPFVPIVGSTPSFGYRSFSGLNVAESGHRRSIFRGAACRAEEPR